MFYYYYYNQLYKVSFLIPFINSSLGKEISSDADPIITYSFSMFILSLIPLFCFMNILFYVGVIYMINRYKDVLSKYPRLQKFIKYYENANVFLIVLESITCIVVLSFMVFMNLYISGVLVIKS